MATEKLDLGGGETELRVRNGGGQGGRHLCCDLDEGKERLSVT